MLKKNLNGICVSTLLSEIPGLVHGYSSRSLGDMRDQTNKKHFLNLLKISFDSLIEARQVHGDRIYEVTDGSDRVAPEVDGLLQAHVSGPSFLGVHVADCVPILLVDPTTKVICALHVGWKGTLAGIAKKAVLLMKQKGVDGKNIRLSIGPHIGMCHYDVDEERAKKFLIAFDKDPKVASVIEGTWHVDLGFSNFLQIIHEGVSLDHIDAHPTCTSCQIEDFYSYRKDSKESYGEIMGVIGYAR